MTSVKGDREVGKKGPRTRMLDPTLARENEIDRETATESKRGKRVLGMEAMNERISMSQ